MDVAHPHRHTRAQRRKRRIPRQQQRARRIRGPMRTDDHGAQRPRFLPRHRHPQVHPGRGRPHAHHTPRLPAAARKVQRQVANFRRSERDVAPVVVDAQEPRAALEVGQERAAQAERRRMRQRTLRHARQQFQRPPERLIVGERHRRAHVPAIPVLHQSRQRLAPPEQVHRATVNARRQPRRPPVLGPQLELVDRLHLQSHFARSRRHRANDRVADERLRPQYPLRLGACLFVAPLAHAHQQIPADHSGIGHRLQLLQAARKGTTHAPRTRDQFAMHRPLCNAHHALPRTALTGTRGAKRLRSQHGSRPRRTRRDDHGRHDTEGEAKGDAHRAEDTPQSVAVPRPGG